MSDIIIDIPKIVSPAYYPMFTSNARYLSYKGSRGSGKSVATARKVFVDILYPPSIPQKKKQKIKRKIHPGTEITFQNLISWGLVFISVLRKKLLKTS